MLAIFCGLVDGAAGDKGARLAGTGRRATAEQGARAGPTMRRVAVPEDSSQRRTQSRAPFADLLPETFAPAERGFDGIASGRPDRPPDTPPHEAPPDSIPPDLTGPPGPKPGQIREVEVPGTEPPPKPPAEAASGMVALRVETLLFDPTWYLAQYPDVAATDIDPVIHYMTRGAQEGRNPNPYFDSAAYLQHNPDVAKARFNPFFHFIFFGAREGRNPKP